MSVFTYIHKALPCSGLNFISSHSLMPITFWHAAKTRIFRISWRQGFPLIPLQFHRQSILNSNDFSPITFRHIIHALFTICSGNNKRTRKFEKRSFFFSAFSSSVFSSSCSPYCYCCSSIFVESFLADVDECTASTPICGIYFNCINTLGSYRCEYNSSRESCQGKKSMYQVFIFVMVKLNPYV